MPEVRVTFSDFRQVCSHLAPSEWLSMWIPMEKKILLPSFKWPKSILNCPFSLKICGDISQFQLYLSRQNWVNYPESWMSFKGPIYSDPEYTYVIYLAQAPRATYPTPSSSMARWPRVSASKNAKGVICPQTSAQAPSGKVFLHCKPSRGLSQEQALPAPSSGKVGRKCKYYSSHASPDGLDVAKEYLRLSGFSKRKRSMKLQTKSLPFTAQLCLLQDSVGLCSIPPSPSPTMFPRE